MNIQKCVEPLSLMFLCEIDAPLSLTDITESLLLAKELYPSCKTDVREYIDVYCFTLHLHFDLDASGIVSNLQLRSVVATVRNIAEAIIEDDACNESAFDEVIDMVPHMFYEGTELGLDDVARAQLKQRLAGVAPLYNMNNVATLNKNTVDALLLEIGSEVDE